MFRFFLGSPQVSQIVAVEQVIETDLAQLVTKAKQITIGQVIEVDTAQSVSIQKLRTIVQAVENDISQIVSLRKTFTILQVIEIDFSQLLAHTKVRTVLQVTEADFTQPITKIDPFIIIVSQVIETDTAGTVVIIFLRIIKAGRAVAREISIYSVKTTEILHRAQLLEKR